MNCLKVLLLAVLLVTPLAGTKAQFVQDESDNQAPDSLIMIAPVLPNASTGQLKLQLDLYAFSDGNNLLDMATGFGWDYAGMNLDSAVISPLADSAFNLYTFSVYKCNIDSSNYYQRFLFAGISMTFPCFPIASYRRRIASYYFTLSNWSTGDSIVVDTSHWNGGTFLQFGGADGGSVRYAPYWEGALVIYDASVACCAGRVGDANGEGGDEPTIGDLTAMVEAKFVQNTCDEIISCIAEADVNQSGGTDPTCDDITIGDIALLQDYLFGSQDPSLLHDCY